MLRPSNLRVWLYGQIIYMLVFALLLDFGFVGRGFDRVVLNVVTFVLYSAFSFLFGVSLLISYFSGFLGYFVVNLYLGHSGSDFFQYFSDIAIVVLFMPAFVSAFLVFFVRHFFLYLKWMAIRLSSSRVCEAGTMRVFSK